MRSSIGRALNESRLYERDYYAWALEQAFALRERHVELLDFEHLAKEVEDLGKRERRELRSRLMRILAHLLKSQFQAARRSHSWEATLFVQRTEIEALLEDSPTLVREVPQMIERAYARAQRVAGKEMRIDRAEGVRLFPVKCPWSTEQILDVEFDPKLPK